MDGIIGLFALLSLPVILVIFGRQGKEKTAQNPRKIHKPEPLVWVVLDDGRPVQVPAHIAAILEKKPAEKKPEHRSSWGVRL